MATVDVALEWMINSKTLCADQRAAGGPYQRGIDAQGLSRFPTEQLSTMFHAADALGNPRTTNDEATC